tara:strand:+ start:263 stop:445 length:183 start_codon:yes stop_codon:yes gene_type:complete
MKYEITEELVIALENLAVIAEEVYDSRRVVEADDIIALQSAEMVRKIVKRWKDKNDPPLQ